MGIHLGYRVVPVGARFRGEYRVDGRYRAQTWATEAEATSWAMGMAAAVLKGQRPTHDPSPTEARAAERVDTTAMAKLFLKRLEARGRSLSHRANVGTTLARFGAVVPDLAAPNAHRAAATWLDSLQIEHAGRYRRIVKVAPSPGFRNRVLAEVRAFCRWLVKQEYLKIDPSRTLERATVDRPIKAQFTVDEVRQICAPCADHQRQRRVALMLLAGLRSDEAAALTWADIQGGMIYVRKHPGFRLKRRRERLVPLQATLATILGDRGADHARVAPLDGTNSTVQHGRHFRRFLASCGIPMGQRTPHSCRHTYGALMTATGVPSILLQAYMGHRSMATTSDYARAAPLHVEAVRGWPMGVLLHADAPACFLSPSDGVGTTSAPSGHSACASGQG